MDEKRKTQTYQKPVSIQVEAVEILMALQWLRTCFILKFLSKPCNRQIELFAVFGYGAAGYIVAFFL